MKKILFVINTLGRAGAERALLEMLGVMDKSRYQIDLLVLLGQGELVSEIPEGVHLLNTSFDETPVLSAEGTRRMIRWLLGRSLLKGLFIRRFFYLVKNSILLLVRRQFSLNHLTRRLLADAADKVEGEYDLAVAYIEGGASFYVHDYVRADRKVAFIHVDYGRAGYGRSLDQNVFVEFDRIFTVSDEVRASFLKVYPECDSKTQVFHNLINPERIKEASRVPEGFSDHYQGIRILTVGRLYAQKALDVSIRAMKLLKDEGIDCRWYVLGEGEERENLTNLIHQLGLSEDFLLLGAVANPYPYYRGCDLYVHASRYEGKSIAIQEAQVLGCSIIVSDCSGNREQVTDGVDGLLCDLTPESIRDAVARLCRDEKLRRTLGIAAAERKQVSVEELAKLDQILEKDGG